MIEHYHQNPRFVLFKHKPGLPLVSHVFLARLPASEVTNERF